MHGNTLTTSLAALALGIGLSGCQESPSTATTEAEPPIQATLAVSEPAAEPTIVEAAAQSSGPTSAATHDKTAGADATTPTPANPTTEKPTVVEYKPPFPDRVDLFVPPKRQGGVVLKEGETEDSVELKGFVRVDRPQVVLLINGEVYQIGEGDSQFGIEVISIQEPKVVLQRGRQRWQASLEN